jgi:ubiquinone/menaquinone biosynthesis C-methylase UbiE
MLQQEQAVATENAPVALVCPDCQGKLHRDNAQLVCGKCGTVGRYLDGVPCFTDPEYYWGEVPLEKMRLANQVAEARGWETAVNEVVAEAKLREYICDPRRADFQHIWDLPANATVLDIGAGWGAIASGLAPHFSRVVAAEGVYERARFIEKRTRQAGLNGVQAVCADFLRLPFGAEQFDAIVLNGVLEWVGLARQDGDPRELQLQFLRRVREMLKPSGLVCVGIENRVGWDMIRGGGDHSGLSYTSLMPRSMARYWCRRHARRFRSDKNAGYRTYTYSMGGFRKLFREAGFEGFRPYHAYDGYNNPSTLLPLDNMRALLHFVDRMELGKSGWRGRVRETILRGAALTGLWRECASEFIFVLNKQ